MLTETPCIIKCAFPHNLLLLSLCAGTLEQRGLAKKKEGATSEKKAAGAAESEFENGLEVYTMPWLPAYIQESSLAKYLRIFPGKEPVQSMAHGPVMTMWSKWCSEISAAHNVFEVNLAHAYFLFRGAARFVRWAFFNNHKAMQQFQSYLYKWHHIKNNNNNYVQNWEVS